MNPHSHNQQNHFFSSSAAGAKFALSSIISWLQAWYNNYADHLDHGQEPRIWQKYDRSGSPYWYAHDPRTGRSLKAVTEDEVLVWLENVLYR